MAKKKRKPPTNKIIFQSKEQSYSFDPDAVTFMAVLGYAVRDAIEQAALEMSEDKKCIPKTTIIKAVKKVGLGSWITKMPGEELEGVK